MILVRRPDATGELNRATRTALARRQKTANDFPAHDRRIATAWAAFLRSPARTDVPEALDRCFRFKCAYCESVAAQDIEHFWPKTDYPRRMFDWGNFLRGCKNCNNAKRDYFPLDGGDPVLLDPCQDDPLDYFVWDFETGATSIRPEAGYAERARATRERFRLDQEPLREERRRKVALVLYLLARVVEEDPISDQTKRRLQEEIDGSRPWLGIVRQLWRRPGRKYERLIRAARRKLPEMDGWAADWL